jgi:hypothetical protein
MRPVLFGALVLGTLGMTIAACGGDDKAADANVGSTGNAGNTGSGNTGNTGSGNTGNTGSGNTGNTGNTGSGNVGNTGNTGNTGNEPPAGSSDCGGELSVQGDTSTAYCGKSLSPLGSGMFELTLEADGARKLNLTLPSIDSGSYAIADCLKGGLTSAGSFYYAELSERDAVLELTRDGDRISGSLEGQFCRSIGSVNVGGTSEPTYQCLQVRLSDFFAQVLTEETTCGVCPTSESVSGRCDVGVCLEGECNTLSCPGSTAACSG